MSRIGAIYTLADARHPQAVRYVGKTAVDPCERLRQHLRDKSDCHRVRWIRKVQSQGANIVLRVIDLAPEESLGRLEAHWIKMMSDAGFRLTNGTAGGDGGRLVGSALEKMVNSKRGKIPPGFVGKQRSMLGVTKSPEHRAKLSAALKGKPLSEDRRRKIAEANKGKLPPSAGKPIPAEQRAKISASLMGKPSPNRGKTLSEDHRAKLRAAWERRRALKA